MSWISCQHPVYYFLSQNNALEKFMFPNLKKVLKFQNKKERIQYSITYFMLKRKF